jgi:hypothetical protein
MLTGHYRRSRKSDDIGFCFYKVHSDWLSSIARAALHDYLHVYRSSGLLQLVCVRVNNSNRRGFLVPTKPSKSRIDEQLFSRCTGNSIRFLAVFLQALNDGQMFPCRQCKEYRTSTYDPRPWYSVFSLILFLFFLSIPLSIRLYADRFIFLRHIFVPRLSSARVNDK